MRLQKGFTLIELLVVIAIIGVLATVVLASLGSTRIKARDAVRHADIKTIQGALEIYYLDHGQYPGSGWYRSNHSSWESLESEMGVTLPRDPVNEGTFPHSGAGNNTYAYLPNVTNQTGCTGNQAYILVYRLEKGNVPWSESPGIKRCSNGSTYNLGKGSIVVGVSPAG